MRLGITPRGRRPRLRVVIAVFCALGAIVTSVLPGAGPAQAAASPVGSSGTQVGLPNTSSAVTLNGDSAFANLKVTVTQTKNLTHQAITVRWSGLPSSDLGQNLGHINYNYLAIMQCWGNDPTAPAGHPRPARETCEYGGSQPSDTSYIRGGQMSQSRILPGNPMDPAEAAATGVGGKPLNYSTDIVNDPASPQNDQGGVPFYPVQSDWPDTSAGDKSAVPWVSLDPRSNPYFDLSTTNEVPFGTTSSAGTGVQNFQVQTAPQAPELGCGQAVKLANGSTAPRPCWLAIVPVGHAYTGTTPLTESLWQHALYTRLTFNPLASSCGLGKKEVQMAGSELAADATTSWTSAVCGRTGTPYAYTELPDRLARTLVTTPANFNAGVSTQLGFTSQPLTPAPGVPIAYAPVAVSGFVIGFNIDRNPRLGIPPAETALAGTKVASLKLNQRLVAKLLAESYQDSVEPGGGVQYKVWVDGKLQLVAQYLKNNPLGLFDDPEFRQLNPEFNYLTPWDLFHDGDLLVSAQDSDTAAALWNWVLADPSARAWLSGTPDQWGMTVNPHYKQQIYQGLSSYPKADPTCYVQQSNTGPGVTPLCETGQHPYMTDMHAAADSTLSTDIGDKIVWQPTPNSNDPNAPQGKYTDPGPLPAGADLVLSVTDAVSAARDGLQTASLPNAAGQYVAPTTPSLLAGVAAMTPTAADSRVEQIDPASARAKAAKGAYPGTMLVYGAVPVTQLNSASRAAYSAYVRYLAGPGQVPGTSPGQLPPGYAPLTAALKAQALTAADQIAAGSLGPSGSGSGTGHSGSSGSGGSGSTGAPGAGSGAATGSGSPAGSSPAGAVSGSQAKASSSGAAGLGATEPQAALAAQRTPASVLNALRLAIIITFLVGFAAAVAAPVVSGRRKLPIPRWLHLRKAVAR